MGVSGQRHIPAALTQRETHFPATIQDAGWAKGPVRKDAQNLVLLGFDPRPLRNYERKLKRCFLFDDDFHLHVRYTVEP
jgi:hypothetical protein